MVRDYVVATEVHGQPPESPLVRARALAGAELRQQAGVTDVAWLHAHPLLWLRALQQMATDTRAHIDRDQAALAAAQAADRADRTSAGRPHAEPAEAVRRLESEVRAKESARRHFLIKVKQRQAEVRALFAERADAPTVGEVVQALVAIADLARRGETDNVADKALHWAGRLEQAYGDAAVVVPDNSAADPVQVIIAGVTAKTKLNCRVCGKGKISPAAPAPHRCPRCHQQHEFENDERT